MYLIPAYYCNQTFAGDSEQLEFRPWESTD